MQKKYHVKKGDKVLVHSGSWSGEEAKITTILKKKDRVVLELLNMTPAKQEKLGKRVRKTQENPKGVLVERSLSVHVSNVSKVEEAQKGS
ncbi:MAG: hypothetical protein A2020_06875 [Lentisphaerae bacterium GWF2_45_14]|nr:MAG: hypothetical protein A2020_06875 [Lentisphaerae bacterium GWF2_45_14]